MLRQLCIATKNPGKVAEFKELLKGLPIDIHSLEEFPEIDEPEETGKTFSVNAKIKAQYYARLTNMPCVADDSGLECVALNGAPGVLTARYAGPEATDDENMDKLLADMKFCVRRNARFRSVLVVSLPEGKILNEVEGICDGMLLHDRLGTGGFGYDPIFWSLELHKSFGEATLEEKNSVSHRAKAIRRLVQIWTKRR